MEAMLDEGRRHLKAACEVYKAQVRDGLYFLHEHPRTARSWSEECIKEVASLPGVRIVASNMCSFGMAAWDQEGVGLVRKDTFFMTNCPSVGRELGRQCTNRMGTKQHRHVVLTDGRAKVAAEYPDPLCDAICKGLKEQLAVDARPGGNVTDITREMYQVMSLHSVHCDEDENKRKSNSIGTKRQAKSAIPRRWEKPEKSRFISSGARASTRR